MQFQTCNGRRFAMPEPRTNGRRRAVASRYSQRNLHAVVVDPARHIVERVPEKMDLAALIGRLRESLRNVSKCCSATAGWR